MSFRTLVAAALLAPLAACAPGAPEGTTELDATDEGELAGDTVYVVTRPDYRKCSYPMCGGLYIKAVNKNKTKCFDGTKQDECYVADIDESALGLSGTQADEVSGAIREGKVLLSGELAQLQGEFAKLTVYKAFEAETGSQVTGSYYVLEPSGITCIKAPCPSFHAKKMNSTSVKQVTDVDMSALGLTDAEISAQMEAIWSTHLVVSGALQTVSTPQGTQKRFNVSEIFSTVEPVAQALCLSHDACDASMHCDTSVCLSGCAEGEICAAVCYGQCVDGAPPVCPGGGAICASLCGGDDIDIPDGCPLPQCNCPIQLPGSCANACGGSDPEQTCYCDASCAEYGDCCGDYADQCL